MLGVTVAVRIWNAVVYDLRQQHDMQVHIGYLRDLAGGHLPATYNAPWYYVLTCVLASPVIAACRLLGTSERTLLHAAVGVSGTVCSWRSWPDAWPWDASSGLGRAALAGMRSSCARFRWSPGRSTWCAPRTSS